MRQFSTVLAAAIVSAVLAGCARQPALRHLDPDVLAKAGLQYYWKSSLKLPPDESIERLILLDENIYCLTDRHRLIAVDAAVGTFRWWRQVAGPTETVFRPTHAENVRMPEKLAGIRDILSPEETADVKTFDAVLINTVDYVLVLDRKTGKVYRKIDFAFAANGAGACDGVSFYVGSTRGWYHAIRLREAVEEWWLSADALVAAPVEHFGNSVYVADTAGSVIATQTGHRGKKLWVRRLTGAVTAPFHVDRRGCFVPCDDNRLYALDRLTGRPLWDLPFVARGPLSDAVQVSDNTVFQLARGDKFYAVNLTTGRPRWSRPDGRTVLGVFDGEVFLLNNAETLLIIDEMLGAVRTSLPMTGWDLFARNTSAPALYVATRSGELACIRKLSAGRLTAEMMK